MEVKIIKSSGVSLPEHETPFSAGVDVRANLGENVSRILEPNGRTLIPTGLKVEIPKGYEIQVRPRSGMALKFGITVLNSPGTIDADYRGEIGIILINHSDKHFTIKDKDRVAQLILSRVERINWVEETLDETARGEGGFGSTGE